MRLSPVVVPFCLVLGCARAPGAAPEHPVEAQPEQLEALIIDDAPTTFASEGGCPFEEDAIPSLTSFDDSTLPEFDRRRGRASNMHTGNARLNDVQLFERMRPLESEIFKCLDIAACFTGDEIGPVTFEFEFELGNNGRVRAATVKPSAQAEATPIVPCARLALASLEFPAYDGGNMFVNYQLTIE